MEASTSSVIYTTKSKGQTTPSDVRVKFDHAYNRKKMASIEKDIEDIWKRRLAEIPSLFNGTKFRLHSVEEKGETLTLNMGITCYKDFQGTNLSEDVLSLQGRGLCDYDDSQAYMSDALGVGALVQTADDHIVLLFRSRNCGEETERWDRPGGHSEPKNLVGPIQSDEIDLLELKGDAVVEELFNSIVEEVISEVNIPADTLEQPGILGIQRSNLSGGKSNVEFLIKCKLKASEVESLYKQGCQAEAYESEKIVLLPMEKVLSAPSCDLDLWNKMTAGAKGLLSLYNIYRHRYIL
ncbi:uridine diphosphate glucose pyrophosphatase NUDT22-like [Mercenaria mercenaria]|uniref:uridine diphosphate glucose pyrophosphatase NUDT22-like n=1 Tax=Mercenaria mercenaria TaxID=6596 RepID=UPI00234ED607|nr:uridine diphosphate glucose pyrophosphatase NUDT22-like [Mercenaria mercenaria]